MSGLDELSAMRAVVIVIAIASGCVQASSVYCEDGRICPERTVCADAIRACVSSDQIAACLGLVDEQPCMVGSTAGTCYGGACLPAGCGNARHDSGEACDDGNNLPGDGCAADCQSNEVCGNGVLDPVTATSTGLVANEQCDDSNPLGRDGCSSVCVLEGPRWDQVALDNAPSLPPPRAAFAMAWDVARDRAVMFGGSKPGNGSTSAGQVFGDTWEWDGVVWTQIPTLVSPVGRASSSMVYDAARHRTVLFGGLAGGPLGDTWTWDGNRWAIAQPPASPPARWGHSMVYDARRKVVVMFGGATIDSETLDDTWEWDGATWHEVQVTTRPAPRTDHVLVYDPVRGVIVLVGGSIDGGITPPDTWEYDGASWTSVGSGTTPVDLIASSAAFDPGSRHVITYGGEPSHTSVARTYAWDGQAWTDLLDGIPGLRSQAVAVTDPRGGRIIMTGGLRQSMACGSCPIIAFNDTWQWDGTWNDLTFPTVTPTPRVFHAVAEDPIHGNVVVEGGVNGAATVLDEVWTFDGRRWARGAGTPPPARGYAMMTFDRARQRVVLFGGCPSVDSRYVCTSAPLGDTWTYDGASWTQLTPAMSPSARFAAAMTYDTARNRVVLFGGSDGSADLDDTWEWDGQTWARVGIGGAAPPARRDHMLAYDPIRRRSLLIGGLLSSALLAGDEWTWDGTQWQPLSVVPSPPARVHAGIGWDAPRERLVLFGGYGTDSFAIVESRDTWEWDGSHWTQIVTQAAPTERGGLGLASSPDGTGVIVIAGGQSKPFGASRIPQAAYGDVWRLRWDGETSYEGCGDASDLDGDALAGCNDPDCWAACTPTCVPGTTCDAASPRCGDGACNSAVENCRLCPQDCGACTAACGDFYCDAGETLSSCPGDCTP